MEIEQKTHRNCALAEDAVHDLNTHLTVIQGYCDRLLRQMEMPEAVGQYVEQIKEAADRAAGMTGQLLACSRRQATDGDVVDNEPPQGAGAAECVVGTDAETSGQSSPARTDGLVDGSGTVLVAEDEPSVRALIVTVLQRCGYNVLAGADTDEAAAIAQRHDGPIDLLVADVIMPGPGGPQLATLVRRGRPELKVLYISGYTKDLDGRTRGGELDAPLLPKPFSPEQLAATVRDMLGAADPKDG